MYALKIFSNRVIVYILRISLHMCLLVSDVSSLKWTCHYITALLYYNFKAVLPHISISHHILCTHLKCSALPCKIFQTFMPSYTIVCTQLRRSPMLKTQLCSVQTAAYVVQCDELEWCRNKSSFLSLISV